MSTFSVGDKITVTIYQLPQAEGEIRAVFTTKAGVTKYVVEHEHGLVFIYDTYQLRKNPPVYVGRICESFTSWGCTKGAGCNYPNCVQP